MFDYQDNPVMSRLYMTGVYFFIMMYTGSNVLPIAKYTKYLSFSWFELIFYLPRQIYLLLILLYYYISTTYLLHIF